MKRYISLFEHSLNQNEINNKSWYHYTDIKNIESIKRNGFEKSHNSIFGSGVYFYGKSINKKDESNKISLECKVNVHKTLQCNYIEFPKIYTELTGKKHNGLSGEEKELEKLGYDSIYIVDEDWLVVFNPKKIKII